jgi:Flp pilus assembly protein TadD
MARLFSNASTLALLGTLLYIGTVRNQFVLDDVTAIRDNPIVHRFDAAEIFTSDYWTGYHGDHAGLYRPLTVLTFAANYAVSGRNPFSYHLFNAILHGLVVLVVFRVIRRATREPGLAALAALIFATHPAQTEAVAGLVGRADLLAALFGLLATELQIRSQARFSWGAGLAFFAALLCKESAIVIPVLILLFNCQQYRAFFHRCHVWIFLQYGALTAAYLAWRWQVLDGLTVPGVSELDNPLVDLDPKLRMLNASIGLVRYLILLIHPIRLSADYSFSALPVELSWWSWTTLWVIAAATTVIFLGYFSWRRLPWFFVGGSWTAIALIPVSNLFVPIGAMMGERFLYLPVFGFSMAVAAALRSASARHAPRVFGAVVLCYLFVSSVLTVERTQEWRDNLTLFRSASKRYPNSARSWRALGGARLEQGDRRGAQEAWQQALQIYPDYYEVFNDLGGYYIELGEYTKALDALQSCILLSPSYPPAWFNLGLAQYKRQKYEIALGFLRNAVKFSPNYAAAHYNLGVILLETGKLRQARRHFERALESDPDFDRARENLRLLDRGS